MLGLTDPSKASYVATFLCSCVRSFISDVFFFFFFFFFFFLFCHYFLGKAVIRVCIISHYENMPI